MASPAEYRQYARECLQWAAAETDESKRQALIEIANLWTHAALRLDGLVSPPERHPFVIAAVRDGVAGSVDRPGR